MGENFALDQSAEFKLSSIELVSEVTCDSFDLDDGREYGSTLRFNI